MTGLPRAIKRARQRVRRHPMVPPVTVMVNSQIPAILTPFVTADNAVAPVLGLLYVSLAVMGAVVVLLGARLVAQRRAAEFTLMRARGAALHQLGWLVLRASAVIAAAAGALAALLAIRLTPGGGNRVKLVAGWRHDRRDAGRARADQRDPATGGGSGHRQAGEPGQRADARSPADRYRGGADRRCGRRACRAAETGPVRREPVPVPERSASAPRHPGGRHRAALLPARRPRPGPDRGPVARGGRVRPGWPGPPAPRPAPRCLPSPSCWCLPWWRSPP